MNPDWKRHFTRVLLCLLLSLGFSTLGCDEDDKKTVPTNYNRVGDTPSNFSLLDQDGTKHALSDYKGQLIVLTFASTT